MNFNENYLPRMSEIAREAGALLMRHFRERVLIEYKGDADLVTIADRQSEALIRERIQAHWPSHDIMGEEQGLADTGSEYRWRFRATNGLIISDSGEGYKARGGCRRGIAAVQRTAPTAPIVG